MPGSFYSRAGTPGARINEEVRSRLTSVSSAIRLLEDCQAISESDLNLARRGAEHVLEFLRRIVTSNNVSNHFRGRGVNYTTADALCHQAVVDVAIVSESAQTGLARRASAWTRPIETLRAASEYLTILNGELNADDSALVANLQVVSDVSFRVIVGGTLLTIAVPVTIAFLAEAGVVGLASVAARSIAIRAGTSILTFVTTNPVAAVEVASFTVGTVIAIGQAGGPIAWAEGLTTPEGAASTAADIFVLYLAIRSGGGNIPAPRNQNRNRVRYQRVQVQVTSRRHDRVEGRIISSETVDELPPSAPRQARQAQIEQGAEDTGQPQARVTHEGQSGGVDRMARARQLQRMLPPDLDLDEAKAAITRARRNPGARAYPGSPDDSFGGTTECSGWSHQMSAELPGGNPFPVSLEGGDHMAYVYPAGGGIQSRAILDGTSAQFTEYMRGTPVDRGGNLIPISRLQQENLLESVQSGIFTFEQHQRFVSLVNEYSRRAPPR